ncbi:sensor domain-containing diguanylate cyclase [Pseudoxanthomonas indica]|uniref:diguanylate cyclase n=1 Tax=Pseudoxanthomonas indica TaxID=428993 RepID=A0A1T5LX21_9GAMM|nr:GGDEF domain-containing protein [Pseudoxanthomonas indica]GGD41326.1 GGDEF domain-containing protein [Pseudoxanthomonas indica]SKC80423.1 diguanylate cyclase (GGDEF) domain-containing protein [Pseudoxanthomonas indica]
MNPTAQAPPRATHRWLRRCVALWLASGVWLALATQPVVDPSAPATAQQRQIDAEIERTDQLRSTDAKAFGQAIEQLLTLRAQASPQQQARIEYLQAYGLSYEGRYDAAITHARNVIDTSDDVDTQFLAGLLIANTHTLRRQFVDALRQLDATVTLLDQVSTRELRHRGLWVAAFTYSEVGQQALGLTYAERILADEPTPRTRCFTQQVKFDAMQSINRLPSDDRPLQAAIEQCESLHEIAAANAVRMTLAKKWLDEGKHAAAVQMLENHLQEIEQTRYAYLIAQIKAILADQLLERGDLGQAEVYANDAIAQGSADNNAYSLASAYRTMFRIAELRDDSGQALAWYRRYAEADKTYLNEVKARELAYQMVRQETLEKSRVIQKLDSQNQVLKLQRNLELQSAKTTRLIVVLLVLLLASAIYWTYKTKRVQMSLKHLAETDALTDVCNRHHFHQLATHHLQQSEKAGAECALIMFDLDHFKSINDHFGHPVGDWVLKQVAQACRTFCRRIDVLGRLGGEEFALLLVGCDLRAAGRLAEDMRLRLGNIDTSQTGQTFVVSASFGVASTSREGFALDQLLSRADDMLYLSKSRGRNRVSGHQGEDPPPHPGNGQGRDRSAPGGPAAPGHAAAQGLG